MNKVTIALVSMVFAGQAFAFGGGGHASAGGHATASAHATTAAHVSVAETAHVAPAVIAPKATPAPVKATVLVAAKPVQTPVPLVHVGKTSYAAPASSASDTKAKK